jgi:hypothetical protein
MNTTGILHSLPGKPDFVIIISMSPRAYPFVKETLIKKGIMLSQFILNRNLQARKAQSVITKIVQQIAAKLTGEVWKTPIKELQEEPTMVTFVRLSY